LFATARPLLCCVADDVLHQTEEGQLLHAEKLKIKNSGEEDKIKVGRKKNPIKKFSLEKSNKRITISEREYILKIDNSVRNLPFLFRADYYALLAVCFPRFHDRHQPLLAIPRNQNG
jgi:hypothetical protein